MNRRFISAACAAVVVAGLAIASPMEASAEDAKEPPSSASVGELRATDAELTKSIADLDAQIATQQGQVSSAQQALDSANQMVAVNEEAFNKSIGEYENLRNVVAARAVNQYVRPHDGSSAQASAPAASINDINRREGFLREINNTDADAIDRVRALKIESEQARESALQARKTADERKQAEQKKLDELNANRAEKGRLDASLQERLAVYAAEDEASLYGGGADAGRASRSGGSEDAARVSAAGMQWPADNRKVNSQFGQRWGRMHKGIDIQAGVGDSIYSVKNGTVAQAGWESGYGKYTCIDHGGGVSSCYAHQSDIGVRQGQAVQAGQLIGRSGNTGSSQAPHLHFEIYVNGSPRNPLQYL